MESWLGDFRSKWQYLTVQEGMRRAPMLTMGRLLSWRTSRRHFSVTAPMGAVTESTTQLALAPQQKCEKLWTLPPAPRRLKLNGFPKGGVCH
jgi:hypothetical protein